MKELGLFKERNKPRYLFENPDLIPRLEYNKDLLVDKEKQIQLYPTNVLEDMKEKTQQLNRSQKLSSSATKIVSESLKSESVFQSYCDFFNHISFRNGWRQLPFQLTDPIIIECFRKAAGIVVRIRQYLDDINPSFKVRKLDGEAKEYLHSLTTLPDEAEFIRELVFYTFKKAGTHQEYVEELTKEVIESYFDK